MGRGTGNAENRDVLLKGKNRFGKEPKAPRVPIEGYDPETRTVDSPILKLSNIHPESACRTREHCFIHNPSDHHMRDWEISFRGPTKVERICPHGIGHTDPDVADWLVSIDQAWATSHGCDGCCDPEACAAKTEEN